MAGNVLVAITEAGPDGLTAPGREALGLGGRLAEQLGGRLAVAAPAGAVAIEAAERGAELLYTLAGESRGDRLVAFATDAARACKAKVVVVSRGAIVLELVPRLAARLGGSCVMGVTEASVADGDLQVVAAIYGGAARAVYRFKGDGPRVIGPVPGVAAAPARVAGRAAEVVELAEPADNRVRVIEPARPSEGPRLEDAQVVVSGGRGLQDRENFALIRELAMALGGLPGASRAIVDDGWAKPAEQVGLTGKTVTPDLYFAIGISGASQHMAGCSNARTLVAINTDPQAPIFRHAHFGIVDDALAVLPELIRVARLRSRA